MRIRRKQKINLAIVGFGKMGKAYAQAVRELMHGEYEDYYKGNVSRFLSRITLDAVVDPVFGKTGPTNDGVWRFRTHAELLESRCPDAAIIAAPTVRHFEIARDFLAKGVSLLIEKPVACTTREIRDIKRMAAEKDAFVLPGHVERYNPVTLDIIEMLKYKVYGRVENYEFVRTSQRPKRIPDSIIIDKLIHDMDLLMYFFGRPRVETARFERDRRGRVIECDVRFSHRNGATGRIFSSWKVPKKERRVTIVTERGAVFGDFHRKQLFVKRLKEPPKSITGYGNNQIKDQLTDFFAGKFDVIEPLVSIDDAIRSGLVIDRINRLADEMNDRCVIARRTPSPFKNK